MKFVDRDGNGNIVAAFARPQRPNHEEVDDATASAGIAATRAAKHAAKPVEGRLDARELPRRLNSAVVIRLSGSWAGLSAARKAKVQEIIDAGALTIIAEL